MDRATIKAQARELNKGNTFELFLIMLVISLISGGIGLFSTVGVIRNLIRDSYYGYTGSGIWGALSWIAILILIPVGVALSGYFVNFVRTRRAGAGEGISYVFKNGFQHFGRYFGTTFSTGLLIGLWCLIPFVGWIFAIIANYRYYFVAQIIHDNPGLTGGQAREMSKRMTDGMKGELFIMELSFIGWGILTVFTFGILSIYVLPYMETTKALYYENLRIRAIQAGLLHPQQFSSNPAAQTDMYGNPIPPIENPYGQGQQPVNYTQPPAGQSYEQPGVLNQQIQQPATPVPQQVTVENTPKAEAGNDNTAPVQETQPADPGEDTANQADNVDEQPESI